VMRHSSLLLMVLFDHAGAWKAMPLGTHYGSGSRVRLLYCYWAGIVSLLGWMVLSD
jgi:hypothetical protein